MEDRVSVRSVCSGSTSGAGWVCSGAAGVTPMGATGSPKAFGPLPQLFGWQPVKKVLDIPKYLCYLSRSNGNQANAGAAHGHRGRRKARNDEKAKRVRNDRQPSQSRRNRGSTGGNRQRRRTTWIKVNQGEQSKSNRIRANRGGELEPPSPLPSPPGCCARPLGELRAANGGNRGVQKGRRKKEECGISRRLEIGPRVAGSGRGGNEDK